MFNDLIVMNNQHFRDSHVFESPCHIYLKAVQNELRRDCHVIGLFPVGKFTKVIIPRIEKISHIAVCYPRMLAYIARLGRLFWPFVIYPWLLSFQVVRSLTWLKQSRQQLIGEVLFFNSANSLVVQQFSSFKGIYFALNRRLVSGSDLQASHVTLEALIRFSDIAYSLYWSLVTCWKLLSRKTVVVGESFQVYPAFSWFLTWRVLFRFRGAINTLWMTSDSDRWAVLMDCLPGINRKVIIQHGLLSDSSMIKGFRSPEALPVRLKNIETVFLFKMEHREDYLNLILDDRGCVRFELLRSLSTILEDSDGIKTTVLIIGQPIHRVRECLLANRLSERLDDVNILVRPHPSSSRLGYRQKLSSRVGMANFLGFPRVNLCLCFERSSLAELYSDLGVETLYLDSTSEITTLTSLVSDELLGGVMAASVN
jgi:hypothetical protein